VPRFPRGCENLPVCGKLWAWLRRKFISDEPQSHAPNPLLRDIGPPRRKKATHNQKKPPKQVELEPKLNAFLDMPWHRMAHASARADADRDFRLRLGAAQRRPIRVGGR
jgi:hypothetical protein